jgi:hypothetical protein
LLRRSILRRPRWELALKARASIGLSPIDAAVHSERMRAERRARSATSNRIRIT